MAAKIIMSFAGGGGESFAIAGAGELSDNAERILTL